MPRIDEKSLARSIKEKSFLPCYLFFGKESYLAQKRAEQLLQFALPKKNRPFNLSKFSEEVAPDELETAALSAPMLSDRRFVWVENLDVSKLGKKDFETLSALLSSLPDSTLLLFLFTDPKLSQGRSAGMKKLIGLVEENGGVLDFAKKTPKELVRLVTAYAAQKKTTFPSPAAYELVNRCGDAQGRLFAETDKLCAFCGYTTILKEHVEQIVSKSIDRSAFDLSRAILNRQREQALSILRELLQNQTEPQLILGALGFNFVDLYRAKCASAAGQDASAITDFFDYKSQPWRMGNALRDARRYKAEHLRRCVQLLCEADSKCKSVRIDPGVLLEKTTLRMMLEENI